MTLKQIIEVEFRNQVLALPDPIALGFDLPIVGEETPPGIKNFFDEFPLEQLEQLGETIDRIKDTYEQEGADYYISLAARLWKHDVKTKFRHLRSFLEVSRDEDQTYFDNPDNANRHLFYLKLIRRFGQAMVQLSSQGELIPTSFLRLSRSEYMLRAFATDYVNRRLDVQIDVRGYIRDPFIATCQLLKNVQGDQFKVHFYEDDYFVMVGVSDNGPGFDLPPSELSRAFTGYSTKNGGLGLQVVKALMDFRGGYTEIVTTGEDGRTWSYSTLSGKSIEIEPRERGAAVTLYIPKNLVLL